MVQTSLTLPERGFSSSFTPIAVVFKPALPLGIPVSFLDLSFPLRSQSSSRSPLSISDPQSSSGQPPPTPTFPRGCVWDLNDGAVGDLLLYPRRWCILWRPLLHHLWHSFFRGHGTPPGPCGPAETGWLLLFVLTFSFFIFLFPIVPSAHSSSHRGGGRQAHPCTQWAPPGGPLSPLGLQSLQAEDYERGPTKGGDAAWAAAAKQS